jgi:type I restriction enzyme S subunit
METEAGKKQFFEKNLSSVKAGLNFDSIRSLRLLVPPLEPQKEFVNFLQQSDKSKFELEQALSELTATYKRIISEQLG